MGPKLLTLVKLSHLARAPAPPIIRNYCAVATPEKMSNIVGADDEMYHPIEEEYTEKPEYPEDVPSVYDRSDKRIAHARKLLSNIVRDLPTVREKIEFVNPYEREWTPVEIRRHRDWHRPLVRPRKAWDMPPVPNRYDSLPLYKYVTNTHTIKGLPDVYDSIEVSADELQHFKSQLLNLLKIELQGRQDLKESIDAFLEQMSELMYRTYYDDLPHVQNSQIGLNVRYESFAERAGFRHLYADYPTKSLVRLRTDHTHKLGQFVFCFRDTANVQYRSELSLPPFVSTADPICKVEAERFLYNPVNYSYLVRDPLFMVPGYELGDPNEFGHLMINSLKNAFETIRSWDAEPEELLEVFQSMAVGSCFSWLNGQAHYKGFTQYTDITYPFSTQAIFTDGRVWYFACYQLNTLDLLYNFDEQFKTDAENPIVRLDDYSNRQNEAFELYKSSGKTKIRNLCWYDGPYDFYQTFDQKSGQFSQLDDRLLEKCLKFFKLAPKERPDAPILRPYLKVVEAVDRSEEELILKNMQETADIKYST